MSEPSWQPILDRRRTIARAGLIYLQIGAAWPPWTQFIVRAAAANRASLDFYFLGAPLGGAQLAGCPNCISLPLNEDALLERVARHLALPRGSVVLDNRGRKVRTAQRAAGCAARRRVRPRPTSPCACACPQLCDMKPMWAALFPELTRRHEFIGYSDHDILLGDLSSEVARLAKDDEMLVPMAQTARRSVRRRGSARSSNCKI